MHGGDIYRNSIHFDFSVNTNPMGVPSEVQWVLTEAALHAGRYPDIVHETLVTETAKMFNVINDVVVYGNGASEIIMAICHALLPKKAMLVVPGFSGYEYCLQGACPKCDVVYYQLKEKPFIGDTLRKIEVKDIKRANVLMISTSILCALICSILIFVLEGRF